MPLATPHQVPWNQFLQPFGVSVHSDVVYDLMSSDVVPVPTSFGIRVLQRYPFFVRAQSTAESVINKDLNDVLTPWPSSIDTSGAAKAGYIVTPLLESSKGSGASTDPTMIDPTRAEFPRTGLAPRVLAVQVTPKSSKDTAARGRLILVGASDFANSDFAQHSPSNLSFALNAVDWLAQDEALIAIRSKQVTPPPLAFRSAFVREMVKYVNIIGVPVLLALAGIVHLARRRRRTRMGYEPRLALVAAGATA
jgi:ABC-type uncharacterized transport system involved in gliding motility auxiliary subunit